MLNDIQSTEPRDFAPCGQYSISRLNDMICDIERFNTCTVKQPQLAARVFIFCIVGVEGPHKTKLQ